MRNLPESLTFAFLEDGTLQVFADRATAISRFEGCDVESGTVSFHGLDGAALAPRFITPNRRGTILGLVGWIESGTYELVASTGGDRDPFALALHGTVLMEPNAFFADLAQLRQALRLRGVTVDWDTSAGTDER